MSFHVETDTRWVDEAHFLFFDHWQELATDKRLMQLKPAYAAYEALMNTGRLLAITARRERTLVGYSVNILNEHLHYADLMCCHNDVLFLAPAERGRLGLELIAETERQARERGARLMLWHAKQDTTLDVLLARRKYRVQDVIYARELA